MRPETEYMSRNTSRALSPRIDSCQNDVFLYPPASILDELTFLAELLEDGFVVAALVVVDVVVAHNLLFALAMDLCCRV